MVDNEESVRGCFEEVKLLLTEEKGLDYLVNNAWVCICSVPYYPTLRMMN